MKKILLVLCFLLLLGCEKEEKPTLKCFMYNSFAQQFSYKIVKKLETCDSEKLAKAFVTKMGCKYHDLNYFRDTNYLKSIKKENEQNLNIDGTKICEEFGFFLINLIYDASNVEEKYGCERKLLEKFNFGFLISEICNKW